MGYGDILGIQVCPGICHSRSITGQLYLGDYDQPLVGLHRFAVWN